MVSALTQAASPHRPYPESSQVTLAGQKRHRSTGGAPHEVGRGGTSTSTVLRSEHAPPQMGHSKIKQEAGTISPGVLVKQEAGGSSATGFGNVTQASAVPWAPVLLDVKAETKTQRSGTYSSSASPSLTHETFTGNLELDTGQNINFLPPPAPSEGTSFPQPFQSCSISLDACFLCTLQF